MCKASPSLGNWLTLHQPMGPWPTYSTYNVVPSLKSKNLLFTLSLGGESNLYSCMVVKYGSLLSKCPFLCKRPSHFWWSYGLHVYIHYTYVWILCVSAHPLFLAREFQAPMGAYLWEYSTWSSLFGDCIRQVPSKPCGSFTQELVVSLPSPRSQAVSMKSGNEVVPTCV